ncbi:hypothetical protein GOBAR_DD01187 [Gossypium barbadense]|nr:hypothetical protein GOBAR_DD01187 [Gossypium barbadense]
MLAAYLVWKIITQFASVQNLSYYKPTTVVIPMAPRRIDHMASKPEMWKHLKARVEAKRLKVEMGKISFPTSHAPSAENQPSSSDPLPPNNSSSSTSPPSFAQPPNITLSSPSIPPITTEKMQPPSVALPDDQTLRRSTRTKQAPRWHQEYIMSSEANHAAPKTSLIHNRL